MLRYILPKEIDGSVSNKMLRALDRFISTIGRVFQIHSMTKGSHSKNSAHYRGLAADGSAGEWRPDRVPSDTDKAIIQENLQRLMAKRDKDLFEQAIIAKLAGFERIGMYPNWSKPGLHLDVATTADGYQSPLAWVGVNVHNAENAIRKAQEAGATQVYFYIK